MRLTSTGLPIHGKTTSPPPCEARPQAKWRAPREHIDWGFKKKKRCLLAPPMLSRLTQQCVVVRVSVLRFTNL